VQVQVQVQGQVQVKVQVKVQVLPLCCSCGTQSFQRWLVPRARCPVRCTLEAHLLPPRYPPPPHSPWLAGQPLGTPSAPGTLSDPGTPSAPGTPSTPGTPSCPWYTFCPWHTLCPGTPPAPGTPAACAPVCLGVQSPAGRAQSGKRGPAGGVLTWAWPRGAPGRRSSGAPHGPSSPARPGSRKGTIGLPTAVRREKSTREGSDLSQWRAQAWAQKPRVSKKSKGYGRTPHCSEKRVQQRV